MKKGMLRVVYGQRYSVYNRQQQKWPTLSPWDLGGTVSERICAGGRCPDLVFQIRAHFPTVTR